MTSRIFTSLAIGLALFALPYCGSDDSKKDDGTTNLEGVPGDETLFIYAPLAYLDPVTQIAQPGATVSISGVGSHDPNCELDTSLDGGYFDQCPMRFDWAQTAGNPVAYTYANPNSTAISFVVPDSRDRLAFKLVVSKDVNGVEYYSFPATAYVSINRAPTISVPTLIEVNTGAEVVMQAEVSDPDGNEVTVNWSQTGGPTVILSENNSVAAAETSFTASERVGTVYSFSVAARDGISTTLAEIDIEVFADAANKLFVSASADVTDPDGSRNKPYSDLSEALAEAQALGKDLILGGGNYTGTLELTEDISIYGGFDSFDWQRDTATNISRIIADRKINGVHAALVVSGVAGDVVLDGVALSATGAGLSRAAALYAYNGGSLLVYGCRLDGGDGSGQTYGLLAENLIGDDALIAQNNFIYSGAGTDSTVIEVINTDAELHFNTLVGGSATVAATGIDLSASSTARLYSNLIDLSSTAAGVEAIAIATNNVADDILNPSGIGGSSNIYGAEICFTSLQGAYYNLGNYYCSTSIGFAVSWNTLFGEGIYFYPPCFEDKASGNYHLSEACAGIADKGTEFIPSYAVPLDWDIDGNLRGEDTYGRNDIGADEFIAE